MSVSEFLSRALSGSSPSQPGIFSKREHRDLLRLLDDSSDRSADILQVIDAFRAALAGPGLVLDRSRRERIDSLFDTIRDRDWPLPLVHRPGGDWVDALQAPPVPARAVLVGGLSLRTDGAVSVGGAAPVPWAEALDALWHALWPLRRDGALPEAAADALAAGLVLTPIRSSGPGKLDTVAVLALAAEALRRIHTGLGEDARTRLRARAFAQPALGALRDRALGLVPTAEAPVLLAPIDAAFGRELTIQSRPHPLSDEDARLAVRGLSFCRTAKGVQKFLGAWPTFAALHPEATQLDGAERGLMLERLLAYIEGSETPAFQYGQWAAAAVRTAAARRNAELAAPLRDALSGPAPALAGLAVSAAQAAWLRDNLDLIRDQAAQWRFEGGLRGANAMSADPAVLCGTGFALFQRVHRALRNRADSEPDGKLGYLTLSSALAEAMGGLDRAVAQHRAALPRFGTVTVPEAAIPWLDSLLSERLRSARGLANLTEALAVWVGGEDTASPEDLAGYQSFVEGYLAAWPGLAVFDFNKLGRMASAARSGEDGTLCRINGAPVPPGRFHVQVGEAVRDGLGHVAFPQAWMPNRWGYRAKQAVELVDLLAEQVWRGRGPLKTLHDEKPDGATVCVIATTSDMAYNGLVFAIRPQRAAARWYYLDSHGDLHPHGRTPEPGHRLFEATVDPRGRLDVHVEERMPVSPRAYPLMVPYTVGQVIDVEFYDASQAEKQTPKERFQTRYRVVRGTIVAYTNTGRYRVRFTDPDGEAGEKVFKAQDIREMNNPHYVSEVDGEACNVRFRRAADPRLRDDLDAMTDIAREHGLLDFPLSLDEVALAGRQKAFLRALNAYTTKTMRYPRSPAVDDADRHYHKVLGRGTHGAGEYLRWARGVCRHLFIREHMGKQRAGLDERFASGAANTYGGDFRGLHIWGEVTLADDARLAFDNPEPSDSRYLSDATWSDPYVALWDSAYASDQRRLEMYGRTDRYSALLVKAP